MVKFLAVALFLLSFSASALAEPERMKDDEVVPPCDNSSSSNKPPCDKDSGNVRLPRAMPHEDQSVIVPPDIPAEGLPNKPKPGGIDPALPDQD